MAKIYIRAGHGGNDPGAVSSGKRREADDNLRMAMAVKPLLEAAGHTVKLSRTTDITQSISSITTAANAWGAEFFLDLHRNAAAATATGIECLIRSNSSSTSRKLAEAVLKRLVAVGGRDRGVKVQDTNTGSLNQTKMPGTIIELLFISNPSDNALFDGKFNEYAQAIANGVCDIAGKSNPSESTPSVPKAPVEGWDQADGKWYYFEDGELLTGWQQLTWEGKTDWYYFDASGVLQTSKWVEHKGKDYYIGKSGAMVTSAYVPNENYTRVYWVDNEGMWDGETHRMAV